MSRFLAGTLLCGKLLLAAAHLAAQVPESLQDGQSTQPGEKSNSAITLAQAEAGLHVVESDAQLDDAVKNALRSKYQHAAEELRERQRLEIQTDEYRNLLESGPELVEELRDKLEDLSGIDSDEAVPPDGGLEDWQRELDLRRIRLGELDDQMLQSLKELRTFNGRPAEISYRVPQIERQLRELHRHLSSPELSSDVTSPSRVAERVFLEAQQSRLMSEREKLHQELLSHSVREDVLEAEHELLKRQVEIAAGTVEALKRLLHEGLSKQASEILTRVDSLSKEIPAGDDAAQKLAADVLELAQQFDSVVRLQPNLEDAQRNVSDLLRTLEEDYSRLEELRGLSSRGTSTVQVLHRLQRRALRVHLDTRTSELPSLDEMQLASIQVREKLAKQSEIVHTFADSSSETLGPLIILRREVLQSLQQQLGHQLLALAKLQQTKRTYLDRAADVRSDISAQLLGFKIHSSPPLTIDSLTEIPQGIMWVFSSEHWSAYGSALSNYVRERPAKSISLMLMIIGLLMGRPWISQALVRCGTDIGNISRDQFRHSLQAVVWTVLLAAPLPLLIGFAFSVTLYSTETSDWMFGLSDGLWRAARIASFAAITVAVCRPGGLGAVHFRWSDRVLIALRTTIRRMMIIYLPSIVITSMCAVGESSRFSGSVGLFSFLLSHLWVMFVLRQQLRAVGQSSETSVDHSQKRHTSVWRLELITLQICLLALIIVACLGYLLTASQLSLGLVWTLARIAGGIGLFFLTLRMFAVKQRRLMLTEAVNKHRARVEAADRTEDENVSEIVSVDLENQQGMDLEVVSDQLRTLLRLLFGLGVAVSVTFFWTEIYPLNDVLNSIPVPFGESLTLLALFKAILIIVVTVIMVRMLPRLLELSMLRVTKTDAGTRNAIYTLGQYAIIALGFAMVANAVNLDWTKLSWIAAGLSVGLGFGLQEVVANFVCGLILLFERPIRVGDIVTIDGTTGTVTRINIRSTTIANWDRQDFVVPNKNLITGTILNWTLTASINRIVVSVGVAYDTDTEKARQILLDVANNHPRILENPPPSTSFDRFGDSSLNLMLFAYLPDLDYRNKTITELHTEIHKRFAAEGIEIPFPQREVHLRNSEEDSPVIDKAEDDHTQSLPDTKHTST